MLQTSNPTDNPLKTVNKNRDTNNISKALATVMYRRYVVIGFALWPLPDIPPIHYRGGPGILFPSIHDV